MKRDEALVLDIVTAAKRVRRWSDLKPRQAQSGHPIIRQVPKLLVRDQPE